MNRPELVASCVAPGGQPVLFRLPTGRVPTYVVIDRHGREHLRTSSLGVAMSAAQQVLTEQGEVWVRASDDTCAHIDPHRVATDTPSCPWIQTIAATLKEQHHDHHRTHHRHRSEKARRSTHRASTRRNPDTHPLDHPERHRGRLDGDARLVRPSRERPHTTTPISPPRSAATSATPTRSSPGVTPSRRCAR